MLAGPSTPKQKNAALPGVHRRIEAATTAVAAAKTMLRPIPAKVLATELDPHAKRARPRIERRGLQMVLRLLAFNAEAWLAEHLNAYPATAARSPTSSQQPPESQHSPRPYLRRSEARACLGLLNQVFGGLYRGDCSEPRHHDGTAACP